MDVTYGDTLLLDHLAGPILDRHIGRTCTGAVLYVERGGTVQQLARGAVDADGGEPVTPATPFDLASLTKIFTATAVLRLVAGGRMGLDDPIGQHLTALPPGPKRAITVRRLLTHSAGLPSLIRLYGPEAAPGDPRHAILAQPIDRPPGPVEYSDVGFLLLGFLIEAITGHSLRIAMLELVLEPLGLDVSYGPVEEAAATELDPWRDRRIRGEVHDENAAVLGGLAGHAGLFGTASAVAALARQYLHPAGDFLPVELVFDARREHAATGDERRGLGWKLRSPDPAAPEAAFSPPAFGHYGFTGTAVWVDPARDLIVVLLTNRVYFGRHPEPIRALRREIFRSIAKQYQA